MAIEVEHSTIPLYLTTQYSLVNQSSYHAMTLRSVVVEEMLHMVNAANVLNAIGGAPFIDKPSFIPTYPLVVPLINMTADVVWYTQQSIEHYEILESTPPSGYNASISAAYLQIISVLTALVAQHGEGAVFTGNASYQVGASTSYGQMAVEVTGAMSGSSWNIPFTVIQLPRPSTPKSTAAKVCVEQLSVSCSPIGRKRASFARAVSAGASN
jgi:hypothetical protein